MRTVEATCTVAPMEFPAGTVPGVYNFQFIRTDAPPVTVEVNSSIPNCKVSLDTGSWTCAAVRLDDMGNVLGNTASETFVVPGPSTVVIGVVGQVSVAVSEEIPVVQQVTVR